MKALLIYLLVTSVCTGVFYGCFRLLMRKETCFAFNRATLLLIVILPLAYLLSKIGLQPVWIAFPVAELVSLAAGVVLFYGLYKKHLVHLKAPDLVQG